jgi:hypothetical protein
MRLVMLGRVTSPHIHCKQYLTRRGIRMRIVTGDTPNWDKENPLVIKACVWKVQSVSVTWHIMMRWTFLCTSATSPSWQLIAHSNSKCCQKQPHAFNFICIYYKSSKIKQTGLHENAEEFCESMPADSLRRLTKYYGFLRECVKKMQ